MVYATVQWACAFPLGEANQNFLLFFKSIQEGVQEHVSNSSTWEEVEEEEEEEKRGLEIQD